MAGLGVKELLVQIKAVNGHSNQALCEYYDVDAMMTHWIWFPVQNLENLSRPEAPKPCNYQVQTLSKQFDETILGATVVFAQQTILQFF